MKTQILFYSSRADYKSELPALVGSEHHMSEPSDKQIVEAMLDYESLYAQVFCDINKDESYEFMTYDIEIINHKNN